MDNAKCSKTSFTTSAINYSWSYFCKNFPDVSVIEKHYVNYAVLEITKYIYFSAISFNLIFGLCHLTIN